MQNLKLLNIRVGYKHWRRQGGGGGGGGGLEHAGKSILQRTGVSRLPTGTIGKGRPIHSALRE